jgi:hypothetical protein
MAALGPGADATELPAASINGYGERLPVWRLD